MIERLFFPAWLGCCCQKRLLGSPGQIPEAEGHLRDVPGAVPDNDLPVQLVALDELAGEELEQEKSGNEIVEEFDQTGERDKENKRKEEIVLFFCCLLILVGDSNPVPHGSELDAYLERMPKSQRFQ